MINREEALILINKYLKNKKNLYLAYSVELILKKLAKTIGEDENLWGLTGLLFNIDYEYTIEDKQNRGIIASRILEDLLPEEGVNAIKANNYIYTDYIPSTSLDKGLIATSAAVEFVTKVVKTIPTKKISDIDILLLMNRFNDSSFVSENITSRIKLCKDVELKVEYFLELVLKMLQENFE